MLKKNLVAMLLLSSASSCVLATMSPTDVMLANEASRKSITEMSNMKMTLTNAKGDTRVRDVLLLIDDSNPLARKTYLHFETPRDVKDVRILTLESEVLDADDDRWLYLPAMKKVRRISASNKGESFMGTDFSYEDFEIADGIVGSQNHKYTLLREEEIEDALGVKKACWVIEAIPVTERQIKESENSKRIIWVDKQHYAAIQEHYFNKNGVLFKKRTSSDVRPYPASGDRTVWRPMRIEMKTVATGHKTTVLLNDFKVDEDISPKLFTRQYVETNKL
jgi:outer membrane lipoprotein-sorting protein